MIEYNLVWNSVICRNVSFVYCYVYLEVKIVDFIEIENRIVFIRGWEWYRGGSDLGKMVSDIGV